jgi:hypothetical protein
MARIPVANPYLDRCMLFQCHSLTGWTDALDRDCRNSWKLLSELPHHWAWVAEAFGSIDDYRLALCAYYMLLNTIEFFDTASKHSQELLREQITLDVPLTFEQEDEILRSRGYRLLLTQSDQLKTLWESYGLSLEQIRSLWPVWVSVCMRFQMSLRPYHIPRALAHARLFDELRA